MNLYFILCVVRYEDTCVELKHLCQERAEHQGIAGVQLTNDNGLVVAGSLEKNRNDIIRFCMRVATNVINTFTIGYDSHGSIQRFVGQNCFL